MKSPLSAGELREKGRKTSLERYGNEWYSQSEIGKTLTAATNLERYGAENPFASGELKEKIRKTNIERYGAEHPLKSKEVMKRLQATNMKRYGVPNVLMAPEIKARALETFSMHLNEGAVHHRKISGVNRSFAQALNESLQIESTFEAPLAGFSVDMELTLPRGNTLLLDIHPTVSHNTFKSFQCTLRGCEDGCSEHKPLETTYHFKRALAALENDRTLIQWYGWESQAKLIDFVRSRTLLAKKVSARKLEGRKIENWEANRFLKLSHVRGESRGQSHCYGLYDEDKLVAAATFGKGNFGSKATWELIRYAVAAEYVIYGASGRLFSLFLEETQPESVVSYIDFSHTTRKKLFLNSMGFEEQNPTGPAIIWHRMRDDKIVKQTSLFNLGADHILKTNYGPREQRDLSDREIMLAEGFLPVHTAGDRVFLWRSSSLEKIS